MRQKHKITAERITFLILDLALIALFVLGMLPADPKVDHTADEPATTVIATQEPIIRPSALPEEFALPAYTGVPYTVVHENEPYFSKTKIPASSFESYSPRDLFGRCGQAVACLGEDLMPTEPRGSIGMVRPTGWHTVKYSFIPEKYLYNRCHLIGYQLSGENANEDNLITGTRAMNVEGMLPFENRVADYILRTHRHVLYRVTPVFVGDNMLCHGVLIEASSVEDEGAGICFCVFVHNAQPGVLIDYLTGESRESGQIPPPATEIAPENATYCLNTRSMKIHRLNCESVPTIAEYNKRYTDESREDLIRQGYSPCGACKP